MLTSTALDVDWLTQAACRHWDPEIFFPTKLAIDEPGVKLALSICSEECTVRQECLVWALEFEGGVVTNRFGIFGGKTPRQRNALCNRPSRKSLRLTPEQLAYAQNTPSATVRDWAVANGLEVSTHGGPMRDDVRRQYALATFVSEAVA